MSACVYTQPSGGGCGSSDVASYWRIRSGIDQGDAPLYTEIDLALVLKNYSSVKSVDFETIWGQGHTQAKDSGNANTNFIAWVEKCVAGTANDVQQISSAVPSSFQLYQNYPNPFNPTTTIKYVLEKQSKVVLKVYNMLGEKVTTLLNQEQPAGSYSVQFPMDSMQTDYRTGRLASGVYIYRIVVCSYTLSKKMILMK